MSKKQHSRIDREYWKIPNPWDTLCFFCPLPDCQESHPRCLIKQGKATLNTQGKKVDKLLFITQFKIALQTGAEQR